MLILTLKEIVPMKNLTTDEYSLISSFLCNTDKINCGVLKDLLLNCVKKSESFEECILLKLNFNKNCMKRDEVKKSDK